MLLSFIVPVYNRPEEVDELLASLQQQGVSNFEVIIVEDGSTRSSKEVVSHYKEHLHIHYIETPNGGPSKARNVGALAAEGQWLVFLDSDVVLPEGYMVALQEGITRSNAVLVGGPDRAADDFTALQKGINYAMTSPLTTGGIRGGKKHKNYCPRTFNMGVERGMFEQLKGFDEAMRFGEDVDFSMRVYEAGGAVALIPNAWVYHKRRTDFRKFFKQVYNSGAARIDLTQRHEGSLKLIHLLPSFATVLFVLFVLVGFWHPLLWVLLLLFALLVGIDSFYRTRSYSASLYAIPATFIQVTGYGSGLIIAAWQSLIHKKRGYNAFKDSFYE